MSIVSGGCQIEGWSQDTRCSMARDVQAFLLVHIDVLMFNNCVSSTCEGFTLRLDTHSLGMRGGTSNQKVMLYINTLIHIIGSLSYIALSNIYAKTYNGNPSAHCARPAGNPMMLQTWMTDRRPKMMRPKVTIVPRISDEPLNFPEMLEIPEV